MWKSLFARGAVSDIRLNMRIFWLEQYIMVTSGGNDCNGRDAVPVPFRG